MDTENIKKWAKICAEKELIVEANAQMNVSGLTVDQRIEAAQKHTLARAEAYKARNELEEAIRGYK